MDAVIQELQCVPCDRPLILTGHSGAGVLLPAIRMQGSRPVAAYAFVDSAIPEDGKSRLDLFGSRAAAQRFRKAAKGGLLPRWSDAALWEAVPDPQLQRRFLEELGPVPLAVYEAFIPVFKGWPDAPCAYLQLSGVYQPVAGRARRSSWPCASIEGSHFHMLVSPRAVTDAMIRLVKQLGVG